MASITQGTLSYHMKVLNDAKLVSCEKNGKWCYYSLRVDTFDKIASFVNDICVSDEKIKRS